MKEVRHVRRLAGYFSLVLILTLGGCVIYDHPRGYDDYPRYYHHPRHHHWAPPDHFRFHRHGDRHGLNEEDYPLSPALGLLYRDAALMRVAPEHAEFGEG